MRLTTEGIADVFIVCAAIVAIVVVFMCGAEEGRRGEPDVITRVDTLRVVEVDVVTETITDTLEVEVGPGFDPCSVGSDVRPGIVLFGRCVDSSGDVVLR